MRLVWQLIGTLLLVGFLIKYWWLVAILLAAAAVWKFGPDWWRRYQASVAAEEQRMATLVARADQQHAWTLAGDPRGTYGTKGAESQS